MNSQRLYPYRRTITFVPALVQHSFKSSSFFSSKSISVSTPLSISLPTKQITKFTTPISVLGKPNSKPYSTTRPTPSDGNKVMGSNNPNQLSFLDQASDSYRLPPPEIARLVDASTDPSVILQPTFHDWFVLLDRPNLPPIAEVSAEELKLAGFRVNANTYAPSRAEYYIGIAMQRVDDPNREQLPISGLPEPHPDAAFLEIGHVRWAPDGLKFAFCIYDPLFGLELWMVDPSTRQAKCLLPGVRLNAVCGEPFTWNSDSQNIIAKVVMEDIQIPEKSSVPKGPVIQQNMSSQPAPSRTFQDLLKSKHDVDLFEHYTTCQLGLVNIENETFKPLGPPAAFRRASPSPDGKYLLIDSMVPPYPYMMPAGRFPRKVEVWYTANGERCCVVAEIPLQDKIPIAFDGVGEGPRGIGWRTDAPAMLYWAEAQDGGDPNREAEIRDYVYTLPAPFTSSPRKLASLEWRYQGIIWGSDSVALISERRFKTRSTRAYLMAPGSPDNSNEAQLVAASGNGIAIENGSANSNGISFGNGATKGEDPTIQGPCCSRSCDLSQGEAPKRIVIDIPNWEDRYNDPGNVSTERTSSGKAILRLIYPDRAGNDTAEEAANKPFFMMQGAGASDDGDRPFVSLFDTVTGTKTKVWQSSPPKLETIAAVLKTDPKTGAPTEVLLRQETPKENPNYYTLHVADAINKVMECIIKDGEDKSCELLSTDCLDAVTPIRAVTDFPHPAPELSDVQRKIVHYERKDGVRLNGALYTPPGYDAEKDGPLPVFVWAYPREYKSAKFAGQTRGSPYRFVRLARTPLYWLTRGYAILDGPEMPIIGEGGDEANDTYIEQLVASAEAAVNFLVDEGVATRDRISIGGHSYGAFMTVNLLAHAPDLFCCGIARSGAYNRTLTPFGFQSEERTLWEAPDVYTSMSPYMFANRVKAPLLLVHGDADNNPGTFPMQSERLYQALKGHGKICRYVSLPHEGHGYRARESVMHVLAEMTSWLDKYCQINPPGEG